LQPVNHGGLGSRYSGQVRQVPQVQLIGAHPRVAAALAAADLSGSYAPTPAPSAAGPASSPGTAGTPPILVTAEAAGMDLRDLAALAEIQARSRPYASGDDGPGKCIVI